MTERWRARPQTARARISNPVSGGECHLTILRRFSWPGLAYMCTKVADSFHFFQLLAAVLKQSSLQLLAFVLNQSPLQLLAAVFMQSQLHVLAAVRMQSGHQLLLLQSKFIEQFTSPCIDSHQMSSDKNNEVHSPTRQRLTKRKPFIDRPGSLFNINSSGISTR